jgi:DNA polymerase-3 subunit delta'
MHVAAGTHLDLCTPKPEDGSKQIKIKPIRDAISALSLKPARTGPRVALIRDAHLLNLAAQSALLKLLEEPPGSALIILVTENLAALMPTIRSRCQIFRFNSLTDSEIEGLLVARGIESGHAKRAAELARGSVGRALELTPEALADHDGILLAFERYRTGETSDLGGLVDDLRDRRKAGRAALDALFAWQIQKIEASLGRSPPIRSEALVPFLTGLTADGTRALLALADRIHWTMVALDQNVNARIAIRDLLLDVRSP